MLALSIFILGFGITMQRLPGIEMPALFLRDSFRLFLTEKVDAHFPNLIFSSTLRCPNDGAFIFFVARYWRRPSGAMNGIPRVSTEPESIAIPFFRRIFLIFLARLLLIALSPFYSVTLASQVLSETFCLHRLCYDAIWRYPCFFHETIKTNEGRCG